MHRQFLNILVCPQSGQKLYCQSIKEKNNKIYLGYLFTADRNNIYHIIDGVVYFRNLKIQKNLNYFFNFNYEWSKWPYIQFEDHNVNTIMEGHTANMFKQVTGFCQSDIKGKLGVEFGCGTGRFIDIVKNWKGRIVGIDISMSAAKAAGEKFRDDPSVLIVCGDILAPPFKKNIFDFGYTIGVLHHLPHPPDGLSSLIKVVKPGGKIACSVYSAKSFYNFSSLRRARKIYKICVSVLGWRISKILAVFYSFFSAYCLYYLFKFIKYFPFGGRKIVNFLEKKIMPVLDINDGRWRVLDMFDAITPVYASTHKPDEILSWFKEAGCKLIYKTNWADTSFVGIKPKK